MKREHLYLFLALIGVTATWYFNIQFFQTEQDTSMSNFIGQAITTFPAKSISADIICLSLIHI